MRPLLSHYASLPTRSRPSRPTCVAAARSPVHFARDAGQAILGPAGLGITRFHRCSVVHGGACNSPTASSCRPQDQHQSLSSPATPGESTSSRKRVFTQMLVELKNNKLKASGVDTGAQSRLLKTMRKLAADSKAPALKVCQPPPRLADAYSG